MRHAILGDRYATDTARIYVYMPRRKNEVQ